MSDSYPVVQDLRSFRLPPNFRGRPAWFVQLWWLVQATLFRWSPQIAYAWRRWLLRRFGAKIGKGVQIRPTAEITYPWKLTIGDWSWIGDYVTLYTWAKSGSATTPWFRSIPTSAPPRTTTPFPASIYTTTRYTSKPRPGLPREYSSLPESASGAGRWWVRAAWC